MAIWSIFNKGPKGENNNSEVGSRRRSDWGVIPGSYAFDPNHPEVSQHLEALQKLCGENPAPLEQQDQVLKALVEPENSSQSQE